MYKVLEHLTITPIGDLKALHYKNKYINLQSFHSSGKAFHKMLECFFKVCFFFFFFFAHSSCRVFVRSGNDVG